MQYLNVQPKQLDIKDFTNRSAVENDCTILVKEDTTICMNDKPILVYLKHASSDLTDLWQTLESIKYTAGTRRGGLVTLSRIFGYSGKNTIRKLPCRAVSLAYESPMQNEVLKNYAVIAADYYNKHNLELAERHRLMTNEKVLPNYRLNSSMFTSGIVNYNNPLKYHFDTGNFTGCWSAMFTCKRDVRGGYLSCPELDISFECENNSLLMFDGQALLHGVTPIKKLNEDAVRYTVVYYSLKGLWSCETPQEEIEKFRASRQQIELSKKVKK